MKKLLLNPFERYAGLQSLIIGLTILFLTSLLAYFGKIQQDGVIDLHVSGDNLIKAVPSPTLVLSLLQTAINWLCMVLFIYLAGIILSRSSVRFIDVLGTQAMARFPFLIACLITIVMFDDKIIRHFESQFLKKEPVVELSGGDYFIFGLMTVLTITSIIWMIVLMYRSYSVSCNIKGTRSIVSFIICLLVAEILSKIIVNSIL